MRVLPENNLPPGVGGTGGVQEPILPITDNSIMAALGSNDDGLPEDLLQHVAELADRSPANDAAGDCRPTAGSSKITATTFSTHSCRKSTDDDRQRAVDAAQGSDPAHRLPYHYTASDRSSCHDIQATRPTRNIRNPRCIFSRDRTGCPVTFHIPSASSINILQNSKTSTNSKSASKSSTTTVGITSYDDGSGSLMID